jgi:hypothetical protein
LPAAALPGCAGELQTGGIGPALLLNLRYQRTFEGRGSMPATHAEVRGVPGFYRVGVSYGLPGLQLSNVQVLQGPDTLVGQGSVPGRQPARRPHRLGTGEWV